MKQETTNHPPGLTSEEAVARAQQILEQHSKNYAADLPRIIGEMKQHAGAMRQPDHYESAFTALRFKSHDMKGQGTTFGFPALSAVTRSLSRLLEKGDKKHTDFLKAVDSHVAALAELWEAKLATESAGKAEEIIARVGREAEAVLGG